MPSSFSPSLRVELIGDGEQAGTWGKTTNTNLGTILEDAIAGYAAVTTIAAKQALTVSNGAVDEARNAMLALNTTTGAAYEVYAPPVPKLYAVANLAAHTVTVYNSTVTGNTTAAGAGVAIPAGRQLFLMTDGTDFRVLGVISSSANTPSTVVERDSSGNFAAGTITANLTGNVTGNVSGSAASAATVTGVATTFGTASAGVNTAHAGQAGPQVLANGSGGAVWSMHRSGTYGLNIGLDSDNVFRIGGWSASANRLQMDMSGNLTMAGNVTAFSDRRLKTNIATIKAALDIVKALRGVTFTKDGVAGVGVVAQEVQAVLPQVVQENADGVLSVAYGNIVGVLIEAIKDLDAKVSALERK